MFHYNNLLWLSSFDTKVTLFQELVWYTRIVKIDTFLHISKDLVRQRCDEIAQKKAPRYLRATLVRRGRESHGGEKKKGIGPFSNSVISQFHIHRLRESAQVQS